MNFTTADDNNYTGAQQLADQLTFSWRYKPENGYFFRAESFFNVATHIDLIGDPHGAYGKQSLHHQSHGESFLSFFKNRLGNNGLFIFDEPEAALSPDRQLALLVILHEMCQNRHHSQFIIATHSPILLAYPGATIYACDGTSLEKISYKDTRHYQITKQFLDNPEYFLRHLFSK